MTIMAFMFFSSPDARPCVKGSFFERTFQPHSTPWGTLVDPVATSDPTLDRTSDLTDVKASSGPESQSPLGVWNKLFEARERMARLDPKYLFTFFIRTSLLLSSEVAS